MRLGRILFFWILEFLASYIILQTPVVARAITDMGSTFDETFASVMVIFLVLTILADALAGD